MNKKMLKLLLPSLLVLSFTLGLTVAVFGLQSAPVGQEAATEEWRGFALLGAGLAIGLAGCGAGIGLGTASAAAIGAIAERPEVFARTLIYVVFTEAIAIYGLVISFMILMI